MNPFTQFVISLSDRPRLAIRISPISGPKQYSSLANDRERDADARRMPRTSADKLGACLIDADKKRYELKNDEINRLTDSSRNGSRRSDAVQSWSG